MRGFFLFFILRAKNRQGLLNLVFLGLILSSMSLVILQGVMGGLQSNLKKRSKKIVGDYVAYVSLKGREEVASISGFLKQKNIQFRIENEHEGLARFGSRITPIVIHGVYESDSIIDIGQGALFPYEILANLEASPGQNIEFFSPSYTDSFFSDLPRSFSIPVLNVISTRVPEIDASHIWLSASKVNNFMREVKANRIRVYSNLDKAELLGIFQAAIPGFSHQHLKTWDQLHSSLVWALRLEKIMMIFLFLGMCFLVCLSISSAVLVFIKKVNKDLTALWVLGASKANIYELSRTSLFKICFFSIAVGVVIGAILLICLDRFGGNIMPDIFVERKIPVSFNYLMFVVSLLIPSFLSFIFIQLGLNEFKNETDYLKNVRSIGQV